MNDAAHMMGQNTLVKKVKVIDSIAFSFIEWTIIIRN